MDGSSARTMWSCNVKSCIMDRMRGGAGGPGAGCGTAHGRAGQPSTGAPAAWAQTARSGSWPRCSCTSSAGRRAPQAAAAGQGGGQRWSCELNGGAAPLLAALGRQAMSQVHVPRRAAQRRPEPATSGACMRLHAPPPHHHHHHLHGQGVEPAVLARRPLQRLARGRQLGRVEHDAVPAPPLRQRLGGGAGAWRDTVGHTTGAARRGCTPLDGALERDVTADPAPAQSLSTALARQSHKKAPLCTPACLLHKICHVGALEAAHPFKAVELSVARCQRHSRGARVDTRNLCRPAGGCVQSKTSGVAAHVQDAGARAQGAQHSPTVSLVGIKARLFFQGGRGEGGGSARLRRTWGMGRTLPCRVGKHAPLACPCRTAAALLFPGKRAMQGCCGGLMHWWVQRGVGQPARAGPR